MDEAGLVTAGIPADFTLEHDGKPTFVKDIPFFKESPDIKTLAQRAYESHREVGNRVPIRAETPEARAAWRNEHLPKLYKAGILEAPPTSVDDYVIKKPDNLPDGVMWNEELAGEVKATMLKHSIPRAALDDLLALHTKGLSHAVTSLKTSQEAGIAALKTEYGDKYDERMEQAKRLFPQVFKTPEELAFFEQLGLGDHPGFMSVMLRLAPLAVQDPATFPDVTRGGGEADVKGADAIRSELAEIMSNNKHPMHAGYFQNDPKVMEYIDNLYKRQYGSGQVQLGEGITIEGRK